LTDNITNQLAQFIATEILKQPGRAIAEDETLISSGLVDSFSMIDLALFVEDKFGVKIDDTELTADTFDTLAQLSNLIRQRQ
jgi:acyl carrier protein